MIGYSRHKFYQYQELYEQEGGEVLLDISRRKPNLKDRVATEVEGVVREISVEEPT